MDTSKRIANEWHKEHEKNKDMMGEQPWGWQWGGATVIKFVMPLITRYIKDRSVLEIGCGGGKWTKQLMDAGAKRVVAIDVHQTAIRQAALYETRAMFYLSGGCELDWPDNSFDIVFTYDVLLHLPPGLIFQYVKESYRVADRMILQLPVLDTHHGADAFVTRSNQRRYENPYSLGYFNVYSDDWVQQMVRLAHWEPVYLSNNGRDSLWLLQKETP